MVRILESCDDCVLLIPFKPIEIIIGFVLDREVVVEDTPGFANLCVAVMRGMLDRSVTVTISTADVSAIGKTGFNKWP